jgi:2-desacetyl-2-hydroxyethyl bacteriochlorophyllide A dehydrogenase
MARRAKELAARGIDAILTHQGYTGAELGIARGSVRDWARARLRRDGWRGSFAGLGVVVARPGRAELVPIEVRLAGRGEVTVEVLVSAISPGTERAQWLRLPHAQPALPFRPGYSGVGRVLAVGDDVTTLSKGDLVAIPRTPHASVATVPASWAVRVPADVEIEQAALVYLAMISGYGVRRAELAIGDSVCVLGSGPIGALAVRLARLAGAGQLSVVARSRRHEHSAAFAGADFRLIDQGLADLGAAVVIDATGDPHAIGDAFAAARDGGTVVLLGSPRGISAAVPVAALQARRLRLVGAHISALAVEAKRSGDDPFRELATTFLGGLAAGTISAADLTGEGVDPREVGLMYRRLADGTIDSAHLDWRRLSEGQRVRRRYAVHMPLLPPIAGSVPAEAPKPVAVLAQSLRFAVVGCGDIGLSNARAIARSRNADLVLVFDELPALAEAAAALHGGTVVSTLHEALDATRVDAVVLSVPHDLHEPMVSQAAAAGLHIIVEKPLAVDMISAIAAVEAAKAANVTLSVCFPYRYETAPEAARRLVNAGALGTFRGATVTFHADKPPSYWQGGFSNRAPSGWRASAKRSGGGVSIMNLTHYVDLLRYVTGCEAVEVSAVTRIGSGQEVEDEIAASVRFEGGAVGTFLGSASTRGAPSTRVEVWGEHGTLELEPDPRIYSERATSGLLTSRWNALPTDDVDVRTTFVERFVAAVLEQRAPDVTALDGLAVQAFVEAAYQSAISGRPERVAFGRAPE